MIGASIGVDTSVRCMQYSTVGFKMQEENVRNLSDMRKKHLRQLPGLRLLRPGEEGETNHQNHTGNL